MLTSATMDNRPPVRPTCDEQSPLLGEQEDDDWSVTKMSLGHELSDYTPLLNTQHPSVHSTDQNRDQGDEQDPLAEVGLCGLINIGNTCYMNAGLQCLRSVPTVVTHCLSNRTDFHVSTNTADTDKESLCKSHVHFSFTNLVNKLWSGLFSRVDPKLFKTTMGLLHPQFSGYRQHDSQEFLSMLLDSLDESLVRETFQGQLHNKVECAVCSCVSVKVEPFVFLSLPLPGAYEKTIELYFVSAELPPVVTRLAITVCRYGSVIEDLKKGLKELFGRDIHSDLLVPAEVLKGTIVRTLAASLPLDRINSKRGEKLYMFEMIPADQLVSSLTIDPWAPPTSNKTTTSTSDKVDLFGATVFSDESNEDLSVGDTSSNVAMDTEDSPTPSVLMMEWHSCNICLEEMVDSDLLTHASCGGTLCANCMQSSKSHQESTGVKRLTCPICCKPLTDDNGFTAMCQTQDSRADTISLLLVTVLFKSSSQLVGHPLLKHFPMLAPGALLYREITKTLPHSLQSVSLTLRLTDGTGRSCSRCHLSCPGCLVSRSTGQSCQLKPGDHITVQINTEQIEMLGFVSNHQSLAKLDTQQLTLNDCLEKFSLRETLSSDNSWYCPTCKVQRSAERTLSVDKLPQTLIIHLKRFVFHGREGFKVECPIVFPMELNGVCKSDSTPLRLTACVCHSGTLHYGHYTSYCQHPNTGDWVYYNDSLVTKVTSPDCQDAVYMLFYQKPYLLPNVERSKVDFDDSSECVAIETLLRMFKPPAPRPLLKKSSSNPDVSTEVKVQPGAPKATNVAVCPW